MDCLRFMVAACAIASCSCAQPTHTPTASGSALQPVVELSGAKQPITDPQSLLLRWLQGEFDNNAFLSEQYAAAQSTATGLPEHPVERLHLQIAPINISPGQNWLLVRQAPAGSSRGPSAIRLFKVSQNTDRLTMLGYRVQNAEKLAKFSAEPAPAAQLSLSDLQADRPDCAIEWRFLALKQQFTSAAAPKVCESLQGFGAGAMLSASQIEFVVNGQTRNRFKKARRFQVWGQISQALKAQLPTGKFSVVRGLTLHDQGGRISLPMDDRGTPSGFALKLEQRSAAGGQESTLHLSLINEQSGAIEGEAWTEAKAGVIGLNLNWIQVRVGTEEATE